MLVEISNGEIIDKLTILKIKLDQIKDADKLHNIKTEYVYLSNIVTLMYDQLKNNHSVIKELKFLHENLLNINKTLWHIEDWIRDCEREKRFDKEFVELARSVYITNDKRSEVKKIINILTSSGLVEEKSYKSY
jgi:hypothetical protein